MRSRTQRRRLKPTPTSVDGPVGEGGSPRTALAGALERGSWRVQAPPLQAAARRSAASRARIAATMRRLEVRIGAVLGEGKPGRPTGNPPRAEGFDALTDQERASFRATARRG